MKIGRLLLRLVVGGLFVGHGTQKLFGWFGGHGLDATAQGFEQLGLRPGRRNAIAAGAAEAGGGALLAIGLATPLASAVLVATMLTAIHRVHAKNGPWAANGGYEYNLVLIAAALALAEVGPGRAFAGRPRRPRAFRPPLGARSSPRRGLWARSAHTPRPRPSPRSRRRLSRQPRHLQAPRRHRPRPARKTQTEWYELPCGV